MARLNTWAAMIAVVAVGLLGAFSGPSVEARISSPKVGGAAGYCYGLQSRLDAIVREMTELRKSGNVDYDGKYGALLQEGRAIMAVWNASCRAAYGSPFYGPPPPELGGYIPPTVPLTSGERAPESTGGGGPLSTARGGLIIAN